MLFEDSAYALHLQDHEFTHTPTIINYKHETCSKPNS